MLRLTFLFALIALCVLPSLAQDTNKPSASENRPLKIISKPHANYTDEARYNNITGTVKLNVAFKSDGTIGDILWINDDTEKDRKLKKYGLVRSAIRAAQKIKFEPKIVDGRAVGVKQTQTYSFAIY